MLSLSLPQLVSFKFGMMLDQKKVEITLVGDPFLHRDMLRLDMSYGSDSKTMTPQAAKKFMDWLVSKHTIV